MLSLLEISKEYKTISFVGMSKNAGKTTALNFLIEEAMDEGIVIGVTSTGRDGETQDVVTGTEKPKVYLDRGTIVAVPQQLFSLSEASLEVVKRTNYSTAIGSLLICRVMEAGYVQIAGPVINAEQKLLCEDMLKLGCEMILIDGAIDRKSIASPDTSEAIILASGAVLSRKLDKVVEETAHVANLYRLPELKDDDLRTLIIENQEEGDRIMTISNEGKVNKLQLATGLGTEAAREIVSNITDDVKYLYIPGAFTGSIISELGPKKLKNIHFVLKDPTKIFINAMDWGIYKKRGFNVSVLKNIKIAAITVNPWAPAGYTFDNALLCREMQRAVPDIPVTDVRM